MSKYEFKGTRGPWETCHRNADEIQTTFACVLVGKTVHDIGDMKDAESRANAQAISAVPEMIEALNDCIALFNNGDLMAEDCGPEYRAACAALTKATGERTGGGHE